jgi:pimeloyl-ACP methyl ester carboxylesterase
VANFWWSGFPANVTLEAWNVQVAQDKWAVGVAHHAPWLTYWWNTQKLFPASSVISFNPAIFSRGDMAVIPKLAHRSYAVSLSRFSIGHLSATNPGLQFSTLVTLFLQYQSRQQGEHESLHRDMMVGFGKWSWSPLELENPFPAGEGKVHLWHGAEDLIVPVGMSRYISQSLPWVRYHELPASGHLFPLADGMPDVILKSLLLGDDE